MAMMQVTAISDIVCGKTEFNLTARVIHLWSVPDHTNPSEEGSIHMVLVDAKGGNIQASIRKHLIPKFKSEIEEGSAYAFENFMVATNDQSYKATQHKYRLNFMHSTKVFKISTKDIHAYHFDFMPFQSILAATREDKLLGEMGVSNAFFGTKMMLNADLHVVANYKSQLDGTDLQLTPVISQMSAPVVLSLSDDLLQTQRMTIGELIEATEKLLLIAWLR